MGDLQEITMCLTPSEVTFNKGNYPRTTLFGNKRSSAFHFPNEELYYLSLEFIQLHHATSDALIKQQQTTNLVQVKLTMHKTWLKVIWIDIPKDTPENNRGEFYSSRKFQEQLATGLQPPVDLSLHQNENQEEKYINHSVARCKSKALLLTIALVIL